MSEGKSSIKKNPSIIKYWVNWKMYCPALSQPWTSKFTMLMETFCDIKKDCVLWNLPFPNLGKLNWQTLWNIHVHSGTNSTMHWSLLQLYCRAWFLGQNAQDCRARNSTFILDQNLLYKTRFKLSKHLENTFNLILSSCYSDSQQYWKTCQIKDSGHYW